MGTKKASSHIELSSSLDVGEKHNLKKIKEKKKFLRDMLSCTTQNIHKKELEEGGKYISCIIWVFIEEGMAGVWELSALFTGEDGHLGKMKKSKTKRLTERTAS